MEVRSLALAQSEWENAWWRRQDGDVAHLRPEDAAGHPDDVAGVEIFLEELKGLIANVVFPDIELDAGRGVPDIDEDRFAVVADDVDPSGGADLLL